MLVDEKVLETIPEVPRDIDKLFVLFSFHTGETVLIQFAPDGCLIDRVEERRVGIQR